MKTRPTTTRADAGHCECGRGGQLLLALLVLFGVVLRWWHLGKESLWFDEGYSAWASSLPFSQIVPVIRHDVSPPLYYLLLHGWRELFGESEFALRALSAVAASLSLLVFALLACRILKSQAARLLAVALFATSALQVQYGQEARSYGLATLFALLSLWGMFGWLHYSSRFAFIIAILFAGASVWMHNMMWFYLAGLNAAWLLAPAARGRKRRLASLLLLDALVVLAYLPWVPALLGQMAWLKGNFWAPVPGGEDLLQILAAVAGCKLWHFSRVLNAILPLIRLDAVLAVEPHLWLGAGLAGAMLLLALLTPGGDARRVCLAVTAYALLPVLAVFLHAQSGQSYFIEKIFTASAAVLPLAMAGAIETRLKPAAVTLASLVLLLSGLSLWGYFQWEQKEDWRSAIACVNAQKPALVVFVANEGEYLYDYYTRRAGLEPLPRTGVPQSFFDLNPPRTIQKVRSLEDLQPLLQRLEQQKPPRVALVLSHTDWADRRSLTPPALSGHYPDSVSSQFNLIEVRLLSPAAAPQ